MTYAKMGDKVRVHYTGRLLDGTVFDTSEGGDPIEFTIGEGALPQGFEQAVIGMSPGKPKRQSIPASLAYGPRQGDLVKEFARQEIDPQHDHEFEAGQQLKLQFSADAYILATVVEVGEETITLDTNHPLAGQDLVFELELVDIN